MDLAARLTAALAALSLAAFGCAGAQTQQRPVASTQSGRELDVDSQGVPIHVRLVGGADGSPALVLVHGGPGISSDYLRSLERLASPRLRVVTYDQRGVGRSGRLPRKEGKLDPASFTSAAYVADLEAVVRSLRSPRVHLLAHSWGGMIAQAYVTAHPDELASLALVGAIPPTQDAFSAGLLSQHVRIVVLRKEGLIPPQRAPTESEDCMPGIRDIAPAYFADPKFPWPDELQASTCHAGINAASFAELKGFNFREGLGKFRGPALVFAGKSDPSGVVWAEDSAAALKAASVEKVEPEACGHFPWLECPQPFYAALEKLLGTDR
jgi:pimeloyl-ACP methyl ester carboxylesterase